MGELSQYVKSPRTSRARRARDAGCGERGNTLAELGLAAGRAAVRLSGAESCPLVRFGGRDVRQALAAPLAHYFGPGVPAPA